MANLFTSVKIPRVKRTRFNLSHERKLSLNFGELVPILCEEVIPSDSFNINTELLIKLAPLKAPVMHRLNAYVHYFFVPTYQIWDNFPTFINPGAEQEVVPPYVDWINLFYGFLSATDKGLVSGYPDLDDKVTEALWKQRFTNGILFDEWLADSPYIGSLSDYFGLNLIDVLHSLWDVGEGVTEADDITAMKTFISELPKVSALPFRAYAHIFNEYYRDENLQSEVAFSRTDGIETGDSAFYGLRYRAWKKDYFTAALPNSQAGDDVILPLTGNAPVSAHVNGTPAAWATVGYYQENSSEDGMFGVQADGSRRKVELTADMSGVTGTSINELRKSVALQRFKELAMRGGKARYKEIVYNFFNAVLPDYYVDRPVFLGGQKQPISIGEVVQTSMSVEEGSEVAALGTRAGLGQSYGKTRNIYQKFPCHGYIVGILSIRPEATYQQGLSRMWTRRSLFDYAWPQFANLGEQEVYKRELLFTGRETYDDAVFGYVPRFAEYKVGETSVHGQFRSSLDYWHFGRKFSSEVGEEPVLNEDFISMKPDQMDYDPFAVTSAAVEHVYVDLYNTIIAKRPLPYWGTPSLL